MVSLMKLKFLIVSILIILLEVIVSIFIFRKFVEERVLGKNVINLNSDAFLKKQTENLKYYYEPKPFSSDLLKTDPPPWLEKQPEYLVNSEGFIDQFEYTNIKRPGVFRIMSLGDSFTTGLYVDTKNSYPKRLERALNEKCNCQKYEVINLGVPGYDIEYSMERFKLRGQKYNPNLIIMLLKDDDFIQITEFVKSKLNEYNKNNVKVDGKVAEKIIKESQKAYTLDGIINYQLNSLQQLRNYYSGPVLLATFPFTDNKFRQAMIDFASKSNGFYYTEDLTDIRKSKEILPDTLHPTEEGYRQITETLFNYLQKENLVNLQMQ